MEGDGKMLESGIKQQIEEELRRIEHLIRITKASLDRIGELPEGTLVCNASSPRRIRYYRQTIRNGRQRRKCIGGPDSGLVQSYKKQRFYQMRMEILVHNKKILQRAVKSLQDYSVEAIHNKLPMSYRSLPDVCYADDRKEELAEWAKKTYRRNSYMLPDEPNVACDGTETRSKGEAIIYDDIYYAGIPFQYDSYHKIRGRSGKLHGISPDFLFRCKDGSLLFWEHLGLLGDGTYSQDTIDKLNKYLDCGFVSGENLIITSDNARGNTNELAILRALKIVRERVYGE